MQNRIYPKEEGLILSVIQLKHCFTKSKIKFYGHKRATRLLARVWMMLSFTLKRRYRFQSPSVFVNN